MIALQSLKYWTGFVSLIFLSFQVISCSFLSQIAADNCNETVIFPGKSIAVENVNGRLIITAGKNYLRSFTWAGATRSVIAWPRKERWNGSLGIYYPGEGDNWKEHDGITRLVFEEGILNFDSIASLLKYLARYEDKSKVAYNDSGLFVFWDKNIGAGGTLNVILWQLVINGKKPDGIPGSHNEKIEVLAVVPDHLATFLDTRFRKVAFVNLVEKNQHKQKIGSAYQ